MNSRSEYAPPPGTKILITPLFSHRRLSWGLENALGGHDRQFPARASSRQPCCTGLLKPIDDDVDKEGGSLTIQRRGGFKGRSTHRVHKYERLLLDLM